MNAENTTLQNSESLNIAVEKLENVAQLDLINQLPMQYLPILLFILIAIGLSIAILLIPFLINKRSPDNQKNSPYECGFEGDGKVRNEFSIKFYLVAILFIIFDLEIAFLFPWAVSLTEIGKFGFWSMMIFLTLLTIGFIYEWKRGALDWK